MVLVRDLNTGGVLVGSWGYFVLIGSMGPVSNCPLGTEGSLDPSTMETRVRTSVWLLELSLIIQQEIIF